MAVMEKGKWLFLNKKENDMSGRNVCGIAALALLSLGSYLLYMAMTRETGQPVAAAADEWVFEKYFENMGNGMYHVEGSDWLQRSVVPPWEKEEPADPTKIRTTQDIATAIGEWQKRHPDRRILSVIMRDDATLIIVTEPR